MGGLAVFKASQGGCSWQSARVSPTETFHPICTILVQSLLKYYLTTPLWFKTSR
ncbi:hypothetical protein SAMN04490203_4422 [Pseudomonas taetrolens]|uniref:Transposase n=1 Tax=Pseudomonas taetrolens TaxID=47884 RepID=A0A1H5CM88_PSETA|nr:hypothetical protein SAMN04490203_4422 [Pseudomonas taetrolens]SQF88436.1 Uncharacterised protein [Pseudomonas taetrolens]VEH51625.1 Uncharacterised protein [Pseudomonas taetrolens]